MKILVLLLHCNKNSLASLCSYQLFLMPIYEEFICKTGRRLFTNVLNLNIYLSIFWAILSFTIIFDYTVISRLKKIIRSGITFVSRNLRQPKLLAVSNVNNLVGVDVSPLCDVVSLFLCHTHTDGKDKLLEWPDRSCLLLYVSARIH